MKIIVQGHLIETDYIYYVGPVEKGSNRSMKGSMFTIKFLNDNHIVISNRKTNCEISKMYQKTKFSLEELKIYEEIFKKDYEEIVKLHKNLREFLSLQSQSEIPKFEIE